MIDKQYMTTVPIKAGVRNAQRRSFCGCKDGGRRGTAYEFPVRMRRHAMWKYSMRTHETPRIGVMGGGCESRRMSKETRSISKEVINANEMYAEDRVQGRMRTLLGMGKLGLAARVRGGGDALDAFWPWDPRDADDDDALENLWDTHFGYVGGGDENSEAAFNAETFNAEKETRERFDKLTAYGESLGIFEADAPKEQWEPQNAEEEETLRHGRHTWTPAEMLEDFSKNAAADAGHQSLNTSATEP